MISKPEAAICPQCTTDGVKSKIVSGGTRSGYATMDMMFIPVIIFDDDGYEHYHDGSYQTKR